MGVVKEPMFLSVIYVRMERDENMGFQRLLVLTTYSLEGIVGSSKTFIEISTPVWRRVYSEWQAAQCRR